jgi:Pentapeptide repeats (9 copies)
MAVLEELSSAEQSLVSAFERGEVCDLAEGKLIAIDEVERWSEDRSVRAELIVQLLSARSDDDAEGATPNFLRLRGAVIVGPFDRLSGSAIRIDATFCRFEDEISFAGLSFAENSSFEGSSFKNRVDFAGAIFLGEMNFKRTTFYNIANFGSAEFIGKASFDNSLFRSTAVFNDVTFDSSSSFDRAYFRRALFKSATFTGYAGFETATFEIALFPQANFSREAQIHLATFGGKSSFVNATFSKKANFRNTTFVDDAGFRKASFVGAAIFNGATFRRVAVFKGASFMDSADFSDALADTWLLDHAVFGSVEVGPFIGSRILMRFVVFNARPQLLLYAKEVQAMRLRAAEGIHIVAHCGRSETSNDGGIHLSDAEFLGASIVEAGRRKPEIPMRKSNSSGNWPESYKKEIARTAARAAARDLYESLCQQLGEVQSGFWLRSLQRSTVGEVALSGADLEDCKFSGAHGLDKMRIGATCSFQVTPHAWNSRLPDWMYTRRRVVAEEIEWRESHRANKSGKPDSPPQLSRTAIASIYRDLRKALEDDKNEPAAADFYYGEMEMRRLAHPHDDTDVDIPSAAVSVERVLLSAYWALSGYGLRAWRALAALFALTLIAATLFSCAGWASKEVPGRAALVDPSSGLVRYYGSEYWAVDFWTGFEFSLRESIALLQARTVALHTGPPGTVLDLLLRLAGPVLLAFAVLALRARTRR